jgi:hypothetical protein
LNEFISFHNEKNVEAKLEDELERLKSQEKSSAKRQNSIMKTLDTSFGKMADDFSMTEII